MWYTGKGDKGDSKWFSGPARVPKDDPRFEALGTLDELCSTLGRLRALLSLEKERSLDDRQTLDTLTSSIQAIQNDCFSLQAEVAGSDKRIPHARVLFLEQLIETVGKNVPTPTAFIVPGDDLLSAECDVARTVARRAERRTVTFSSTHPLSPEALAYINRLSSVLYVCGRLLTHRAGAKEQNPRYFS